MRFLVAFSAVICLAAIANAAGIGATTQEDSHGPDLVVLKELTNLYQPVPFDHKTHAQMGEMWDGCTTCHHRTPSTQPSLENLEIDHHDQNQSARMPACKSCHAATVEAAEIRMPTLKGAYHRQCLNCHRDWANANSCTICHEPVAGAVSKAPPTTDDIIGRMHPPIPEPDEAHFVTRFTPAAGKNVLFRHKEHTEKYGLRCVNCHQHDDCSDCHSAKPASTGPRPIKPGRTWAQTHRPCVGCHEKDRCQTCHYDDQTAPPPPFEHRMTTQQLDKDHVRLKCALCHTMIKARTVVTCGDAKCHNKPGQVIAFPQDRPGELIATAPTTAASTRPVVEVRNEPAGTVKRVRRSP
jgi:hypothetical protein